MGTVPRGRPGRSMSLLYNGLNRTAARGNWSCIVVRILMNSENGVTHGYRRTVSGKRNGCFKARVNV
jgi:hypothetical protein